MTGFGVLAALVGFGMAIGAIFTEPKMALTMLALIAAAPAVLSYLVARYIGWFAGISSGVVAMIGGVWAVTEIGSSLINDKGSNVLLVVLAIAMIGGVIWWMAEYLPSKSD